MLPSPLSDLRGKRRITIQLDAEPAAALRTRAEVVFGDDPQGVGLQVLIAERSATTGLPATGLLRSLHRWRQGRKSFPLVTVIRSPSPDAGTATVTEPATLRESRTATDAPRPLQPSFLTDRAEGDSARRRWLGKQGTSGHAATPTTPRQVLVLGPDSGAAPVRLTEEQAARMLQAALNEPSAISARRRIVGLLKQAADAAPDHGSGLPSDAREAAKPPGVDNGGLFSLHYLRRSLPREDRWTDASARARPLLGRRGTDLIRGLGFRIGDRLDRALVLLAEHGEQRALAVLLEGSETFDAGSARLGMSPAAYGLNQASKRGAPWLILLRGDEIRLYATKPGTGVGSRSPVETWFSLDLAAMLPQHAGYLDLVFSADALASGGSVSDLLAKSRQFAADLGGRLRQRVYERVVPGLGVGVANALDGRRLPADSRSKGPRNLDYAYRLSLRILFRLLFQAYAEDRGLLPYGRNERFDRHSLKRLARLLSGEQQARHAGEHSGSAVAAATRTPRGRSSTSAKQTKREWPRTPSEPDAARMTRSVANPNTANAGASTFDSGATTLWRDLQTIWRAIDKGDRGLDVPAYDGGLFDADPGFRREGTDLADIELTDDCIGPALLDLLVDETPDGDIGPVDFRSLSVREFGTIYEGLLESELSRAEMDLTIDRKGVYVPAGAKHEVVVAAGEVYFHNRSGQRKATGSYFTPEFAVEHLLDHALEPVLAEHLERVAEPYDRGDHAGAAEAFWDFRVADISMGSGHFLIAAVDRIERGMRRFLADRPLASVNDELARLERKAREALGPSGGGAGANRAAGADSRRGAGPDSPELEPSTLLRRQIARRCIHGVDVNETAVELARVAVWIHTFVPGLPMSTLDHNLVCGDSLTGIGTVDEALDVLDPDRGEAQRSLFSRPIEDAMSEAARALGDVAAAQEADTAEVLRNRETLEEARTRAAPARRLFDAAVAIRLGVAEAESVGDVEAIARIADRQEVRSEIERLQPVHMPLRFPQVFERSRPGFDVLIGNPPWEEARIEEQEFWALRFPGYQGLPPATRARRLRELKQERPDLVREYEALVDAAKATRKLLLAGPYPGMGASDPDLYKAFCWRFWLLVREGGAVGVVLPRSALAEKGSQEWRKAVLAGGAFGDVTLLMNKGRWMFDMEPRYTVALASVRKGLQERASLQIRGPYDSHAAYDAGMRRAATTILVEEFLEWSDSAALPLIPNDDALRVFRKLRRHPRLDLRRPSGSASRQKKIEDRRSCAGSGPRSPGPGVEFGEAVGSRPGSRCWRTRRHLRESSSDLARKANDGRSRRQGSGSLPLRPARSWRARPYREVDAGKDRRFFALVKQRTSWPIFSGRSFRHWLPDTGHYYAWTNTADVLAFLQRKRERANRNRRSAFSEFPREWAEDEATQPWRRPRIAYRNVARATDSRTVIAALVPGEVILVDKAPYLLWPEGDCRDEAYLLGVLCSMPLDWFARRAVELSLTYHIFNSLPIPRPELHDPDPASPGLLLRDRVIHIAGRLATAEPDHAGFREWAAAVGVEAGSIRSEDHKNTLIEELDAVVALLYGLDDEDLRVIYDTFHTGADYSERYRRVTSHCRRWRRQLGLGAN